MHEIAEHWQYLEIVKVRRAGRQGPCVRPLTCVDAVEESCV
jgi:hypothetical protein